MLPSSDCKPGDNCSASQKIARLLDRARATPVLILLDAPTAAAALSISERAFHQLRKRSDFPRHATVVLGPRCVRFRVEALHTFTLSLAEEPADEPRPPPRSREDRRQQERGDGAEARQEARRDSGATNARDRAGD